MVAACTIDTGGVGPSATVTGAGWVSLGTGGTNVAAYYILDAESVETPPDPGFSCSRSDYWACRLAYIR